MEIDRAQNDQEGSGGDSKSTTEGLELPIGPLTAETIQSLLVSVKDPDIPQACLDILISGQVEDIPTARFVIEHSTSLVQRGVDILEKDIREVLGEEAGWNGLDGALKQILGNDNSRRILLERAGRLHDMKRRLETYVELNPGQVSTTEGAIKMPPKSDEVEQGDPWSEGAEESMEVDAVIDDPWETASNVSTTSKTSVKSSTSKHVTAAELDEDDFIPLNLIFVQPIVTSALTIASTAASSALKLVFERHPEVFPYRLAILEALPSWVSPVELDSCGLLPRLGSNGREAPWTARSPIDFLAALPPQYHLPVSSRSDPRDPLTADELAIWYSSRIASLDELGLLDLQLAWVQHGASSGVPGLDALGEDLSLLSRLIYDGNLTPAQHEKWNLSSWRQASESSIVSAYVSNSTGTSIVKDIRKLVLPYLHVLESRAERAGKSDPLLVDRYLHDAILNLPLHLALPVFESSTATKPATERLIKNDLTVARLALASLYGSDTKDAWAVKSAIFECLPVWDVSGGDPESDKEATAMTLDSIATFVRPRKAGDKPPTAQDLYLFFTPLPFASLSRALDILDVHLESGEILARWDTPVQLRFLLQSARDKGDQTELAEKMVRRQAAKGPHTDVRWSGLWGDMIKLNGGGESLLRGAFGVLSVEDLMRIYLGGLLGCGSK
jgi:hypothetical protein